MFWAAIYFITNLNQNATDLSMASEGSKVISEEDESNWTKQKYNRGAYRWSTVENNGRQT